MVRFVLGFLTTMVVLNILWLCVGCLEFNFQLDQCHRQSWIYFAIRTHAVTSKMKMLLVSSYFIVNLLGAGRGDITAHNLHEAVVVAIAIFIISFLLAYVQAHVFALVYKLTMTNRIYLQNKDETNKVLNT